MSKRIHNMPLKKTVPILILIAIITFIIACSATTKGTMTQPITINTPIYDGDITENPAGVYTRTTNFQFIRTYGGPTAANFTGFVKFNTVTIPDNATINMIEFRYYVSTAPAQGSTMRMRDLQHDPQTAGDQTVFEDALNGSIYATVYPLFQGNWYQTNLSWAACVDMENLLGANWFAIGTEYMNTSILQFRSMEHANTPKIIVHYTNTNYNYTFRGLYGENATFQGSINVTGYDLDGSYEFTVNRSYVAGFDQRPLLFTFDVNGSTQRRLYTIADVETFFLFLPESPHYVYEFTIRDYTGLIGLQAAYLEPRRSVNGTEYMMERMRVQETVNAVPLTLSYGKVYTLRMYFIDGSTYAFGFFVAGVDPTPILNIRDLAFSRRAQLTYSHVTAEATRPTWTNIIVNYNDSLAQTNLVEVWVNYRNGTNAWYSNSTADNVQFNWGAAVNITDYVVELSSNHTFFTQLNFTWYLGGAHTHPNVPSFAIFGTWGGIPGASMFPAMIIVTVALIFSAYTLPEAGIVLCGVTAVLRYIDWITLDWDLIMLALGLSVIMAVLFRRGKG